MKKKIIVFVFALSVIFAFFASTVNAARDTITISGETTLFSEDFENYDEDFITLKKAYSRRLDNWTTGTIYHECQAYLNQALVDGCGSNNAILTCERMASSEGRNFAVELPRSRWATSGNIHIRMNIKPQASITQRFDIFEDDDTSEGMTVLSNSDLSAYLNEWLVFDMFIDIDNKTYTKTLKKVSDNSVLISEGGAYLPESVGGIYLLLNKGNTTDSWSDKAPIVDNIYIGKITREEDKDTFSVASFSYTDENGAPLSSISGAETITAKLNIKSGKNISNDARIYIGVYSSEGKLKGLAETDKLFTEGYFDVLVSVNLDSPCESGDKACVFVWGKNDLFPLLSKFEVDDKLIITEAPEDGFDIHNDTLKAYLNDSYESCVSTYADGSKGLDKPLPATIKWASGEGFKYVVKVSENPDMSDAWEFETYNNFYDIYNLKVGTTYYWTVTAILCDTPVYTSDVRSFTTNDKAPRNLYVEGGMANFRDIGGWNTSDGGKVQQGLLYRSRRLEYLSAGSLVTTVNAYGIKVMKEDLKIKTELDFRNETDDSPNFPPAAQCNILGIEYYRYPMVTKDDYLSSNKEAIRNVFNTLAYDENYPIVFHCTSGADRTGVIAWLIDGLAGVSKDDLYRDYLITNFHANSVSRDVSKISGKYVKTLDNYTGANYQKKVYNYLANEIGIPTEKLDHIIYILKNGLGETPHYVSDDVVEPDINETIILNEDFEEPVSANSNYATVGGWVLDEREGDTMTGYGSGYNSATGFYPTFRAGHRSYQNETRNSVYYVPTDNVKSNGVYTIMFDFYKGSKAPNNPIRIGSGREYSDSTSMKIVDLYSNSYATDNRWENVKIDIDLDEGTYSYTITKSDGSTKTGSGTYDFDSVDYISFAVKASNNITGGNNTDGSGQFSKIDNLKIVYATEN